MLTGMQMSSLECKCAFYGPEHNAMAVGSYELNFERLEIQKMKIPTDRAQTLDGKNRVIYLFIMFTPIVMIIKMLKKAHFLYFQVLAAKSSQFQQYIIVHLKDFIVLLQKMV